MSSMSRTRKALLSAVIMGLAGLGTAGTFSAFSATTSNGNNSFAVGDVTIADNDAGAAMFAVTNAKPLQTEDRCIKVTYTGSLDSTVKLYSSAVGAAGTYLNLTVTSGTQATPSFSGCTGFTADANGDVYSGTLATFASTRTGWSNGLAINPPSATEWVQNDAVVYRFRLQVQDDSNAQTLSTGTWSFTWEAQNL
jgi:hypothetical protein